MPAGGMQGFIANRAGSPRPGSANGRRANATALKVQVKPTALRPEPAQQHTGVRRQPLNSVNQAGGQPNHGQRRDSGETINGRHDLFGTDAGSSIDTTVNGPSSIKDEHGQHTQQRQSAQQQVHGYGQEEFYSEDESGDQEESEYEEDGRNNQFNYEEMDEAQQALIQGGFLAEGNSYPSTTSGPTEDLFNQRNIGQQRLVDSVEAAGSSEVIPRHVGQGHTARQGQPSLQRANHPSATASTMPAPTIYQKSAAFREDERANTNLTFRGGTGHHNNSAPVPSSQPPAYSQAVPQASRSANLAAAQRAPVSATQIPQRGTRPPSGPPFAPPIKPAHVAPAAPAPVAPVARPAQPQPRPQPKEEPVALFQPIDEDEVHETEGPLEDYDIPELFNLNYDQLRNEDFDEEPRGKDQVLADDMQPRALKERLVHAQKDLTADNQAKFFRMLPTREWEDAGEWFMDQFSDIIDRAKKTRQNKRKLAREFEDKVEKRYRQVAKRQQNVEVALDGMKAKGQGLIPKSPRASKEPGSKTPRARKR
ncbi:hypothetical protein BU23DRAFT_551727 [Bimuria novae-zelandiae CBS 107.79]|uniref:Extracellular mutant protein 11 C-terminal domain-containing protein n=1 Tax=Bimuria novae-zelandiae CBS 107.79 TaxID=1447943 RepID=A0A6A5VIL4_9PLEO|nr:hypothetical protein BU23DRAFT_551727 [Bimuria novae-zelandiae CBS 107.79]